MKSLNDFVNSVKNKQAEDDYFAHHESIVDCEDDVVIDLTEKDLSDDDVLRTLEGLGDDTIIKIIKR